VKDADPWGNEPIYAGETMVGRATTGAYGHTIGKSLALAYVDSAHTEPGTKLDIVILGERMGCKVIPDSPWDPENERLRA
jgi:dimethylglycine dehydrogenase